MIKTVLFVIAGIILEKKYSPRLAFIKESNLLVLYYTQGNSRKLIKLLKW